MTNKLAKLLLTESSYSGLNTQNATVVCEQSGPLRELEEGKLQEGSLRKGRGRVIARIIPGNLRVHHAYLGIHPEPEEAREAGEQPQWQEQTNKQTRYYDR